MSRARVLFHVEVMLSLAFLLAVPALAQYGASLQGTVTDKSGAVVGDAKVTATNQATGVSRDTVTSGSGFYRIAGLSPENTANFFNVFNILNLTPLIPATASTDIVNTNSFGRPSDGLAGRVIEFQARLTF